MAEKEIGEVMDFFAHVGVIAIKLNAPLKVGNSIKIRGGENEFTETIESMQIDRKPVQEAKKGDSVGIKISGRAHKGNKVFLIK
jgi:putative protease